MTRNDHPAWEVYNLFRTAKLNEKYYAHLLARNELWNAGLEIAIAIAAPTGTISALWFWSDPLGAVLWKVFLVIAAIASLVKPFLKMSERIKVLQNCMSGYRMLAFDLKELINDLIEKEQYTEEIRSAYKDSTRKVRELILKEPEAKQDRRLIKKYTAEVNNDLEGFNFYIPEEK